MKMRRALIIGIDDYPRAPLTGCVNDAQSMAALLSRHEDGSPNFDCLTVTAPQKRVTRSSLKQNIDSLFQDKADVALLYFSGHGTASNLGGYLVTQDAERYDEGVPMYDILTMANNARMIQEVVIFLDCCNSGAFGELPALGNDSAFLREGLTVLTAGGSNQPAMETGGRGAFTQLVHGALSGGAADVLGRLTVASVYAFVDQTLGAWGQRPLFKSHVSSLISLRNCKPGLPLDLLRRLPEYFSTSAAEFNLDPSFEHNKSDPAYAHSTIPSDPAKEKIFAELQRLRATGLLTPVGEDHLYYAAMNSKSCRLTPLGRFYWQLASEGKI
jgi:hypothetical protein